MKPDRSFMRELKQMDKRLDCVFRPEHEHFVVTYQRAYGEPVNLHLVKTEDGGFRQPDRRDLDLIKEGDLENQRLEDRLLKTSKYLYEVREESKRKNAEAIRDATRDDKHFLINAYRKRYGLGKPKPAYRQV